MLNWMKWYRSTVEFFAYYLSFQSDRNFQGNTFNMTKSKVGEVIKGTFGTLIHHYVLKDNSSRAFSTKFQVQKVILATNFQVFLLIIDFISFFVIGRTLFGVKHEANQRNCNSR